MLWIEEFFCAEVYALLSRFTSQKSSATDYFRAFDSLGCVTGIHNEASLVDNSCIVVVRMVRHDQHAIVVPEVFQWDAMHLQVILPAFANKRKVRVVVAYLRACVLQEFDDGQRRGLAQVVNIFFVSQA